MSKSKRIIAHIGIFLVNLIYAANYTVAKEVMPEYIKPFGFIFLRALSGFVFFWIFQLFLPKEKIHRKDYLLIFSCALFGLAINQLSFFKGLSLTTPIHASLILTTVPIVVLVVSAIMLKEKITPLKIAGITIGAIGAIIIILSKETAIQKATDTFTGDLLVLVNGVSYAIYLVLVKRLMARYQPITVIKWVFSVGFLMIIPFGLEEASTIEWSAMPSSILWAVAFVLFCVSIMTYLINAYGLKVLRASVVSGYIYLQPLLATLIAVLAQRDVLTFEKVVAGILILSGVYLITKKA